MERVQDKNIVEKNILSAFKYTGLLEVIRIVSMFTIKRNLLYSSLTSVLKFYSGSLIFILFARYLTVAEFGELNYGFSLGLIVGTCAEFGYSLMTSRDIPQHRYKLGLYVFNTLVQKILISIVVTSAFIAYLNIFFLESGFSIGLIFIGYAICTSFTSYFLSVFRAKNHFSIESVAVIINAIFTTAVLFYLVFCNLNAVELSVALLVSRLIQASIVTFFYFYLFRQEIAFRIDWDIQKYLTINSWSFGLHFIVGIFYFQIDTQILKYYYGNEAVGLYQAPFKFILLILIAYEVIFQVYLPHIANQFKRSIAYTLNNILAVLMKYLITLSVLAFAIIAMLNNYLISLVFGENYIKSAPIMVILAAMLVVRTIASVYGILLTVGDFQKYRVSAVFASLLVNLGCNFYFIPMYGMYGAASVSLATHMVLVGIYLFFVLTKFQSSLINWMGFAKLVLLVVILFVFWIPGVPWMTRICSLCLVVLSLSDFRLSEIKSVLAN